MMKLIRDCLWMFAAMSVTLIAVCSRAPTQVSGGSGSETVIGMVTTPQGGPAVQATVRLRRADYIAPLTGYLAKSSGAIADVKTDGDGAFRIEGIDTGRYVVEITDLAASAVMAACTVSTGNTPVDIGTVALAPFGALRGRIDYARRAQTLLFVQIFGLDRLLPVDSAGAYAAADLPAGTFTLRLAALDTAVLKPAVMPPVAVASAAVTDVKSSAAWQHSKLVQINTTATGAAINQDVYAFPLLIRLDGSNFDFSPARDSGQDIRFEKNDGTPLPYQIEQWDRAGATAVIWVRIDTVYAGSAAQSFVMRWGNPNAAGVSDGNAVFDTADGYAGVWHLGDPGASLRRNSAQDAFHARPGNYKGTESVSGIAGRCDNLDSMAHDTLGVINTGLITVSAWINCSAPQGWARIIQRPDTGLPFFHTYGLMLDSTASLVQGVVSVGNWPLTATSATPLAAGVWTYVCMTLDSARITIFVNGTAESSTLSSGTIHENNLPAYLAWQPAYPGSQKFIGRIDEARIETRPRSAAWIKLCYENQKPASTVVTLQ